MGADMWAVGQIYLSSTCVSTGVLVCLCMSVSASVSVSICVCVCIHKCMSVCLYLSVYVPTCEYPYRSLCVCMCPSPCISKCARVWGPLQDSACSPDAVPTCDTSSVRTALGSWKSAVETRLPSGLGWFPWLWFDYPGDTILSVQPPCHWPPARAETGFASWVVEAN